MPVDKRPVGALFSTRRVLDRTRFSVSSMVSSSLSLFREGILCSGTFHGIVSCTRTFEFSRSYLLKISCTFSFHFHVSSFYILECIQPPEIFKRCVYRTLDFSQFTNFLRYFLIGEGHLNYYT